MEPIVATGGVLDLVVNGTLTLSREDCAAVDSLRWLHSLNFVMIEQRSCRPVAANPMTELEVDLQEVIDQTVFSPVIDAQGEELQAVSFSFNASDLIAFRLPAGRYHVQVTARHYRTTPTTVEVVG